jgi:hypothetical protein
VESKITISLNTSPSLKLFLTTETQFKSFITQCFHIGPADITYSKLLTQDSGTDFNYFVISYTKFYVEVHFSRDGLKKRFYELGRVMRLKKGKELCLYYYLLYAVSFVSSILLG